MFSEYASRFLQQSTARLQQSDSSRTPLDRRRSNVAPSGSRYIQRPSSGMLNPYQQPSNLSASQTRFPFASRLARQQQQAPLFHSTQEDFEEQDEGDEHEREVADYYALQRSRRQFGPSNLTESEELDEQEEEEEEDGEADKDSAEGQRHDRDERSPRGRMHSGRVPTWRDQSVPESDASVPSSKGKAKLVDVNLASTIDEEPPESLANLDSELDPDEPPPPFQTFRTSTKNPIQSSFLPVDSSEANLLDPRPPSPDRESVPQTVILPTHEPPRHDAFWATFFEISLFAMFASFVLIWFHTSAPKTPLGDTIYSALRGSTNMLLWDTVLSIIVALIWLALLRNYVRNLVYLMLLAVPVVLFTFSLYPLVSSFRGSYQGNSIQDTMMRWLSPVPFIFACVWTWSVVTHRHSLSRSIKILEFSTKILSASPYLIMLGFFTLGVVVTFTWVWMLMFERLFLSGHFASSGTGKWIIYANSWWLGVCFILQYLWTLGVIAGIQRATTAATVSQWYFHRFAVPQPSSQQVVRASFNHAIGALLGTICLSTFLSLLIRLPLIILPARVGGILNMCAYWIIPTSLATLTNPLTLTYAAIHSQPLGIAARGLGQLSFVSRTNPSNTLGPRNFNPKDQAGSALIPYRLAKLLLQATKWIMSAALGFGGWVRTARNLRLEGADTTIRGSLYAYIVALIAGTIGFAVLGAIENVVGAVLDAAVICWASETGGRAEARFCREAGELFGNDDAVGTAEARVGLR